MKINQEVTKEKDAFKVWVTNEMIGSSNGETSTNMLKV